MPKWLLVLACVLAAPQAAAQANFQPWNAGQQRFSVGDYASAYEIWLPEAKAGDPRAQYSLGVLYERGHGVPRDLVTAAKWYALSARQEYAPAVTALRALAPKLKEMM